MAAFLGRTEIEIKNTTVSATVSDDPIAKLMYYFNCVCYCVDVESDATLNRLKNYNNYRNLTSEEEAQLLVLCLALSPDHLIGSIFFPNEDLKNFTNEFFELKAVNTRLVIAESLLIGGQQRRVHRIMMFTKKWIETNYINPMLAVALHGSRQRRQLTAPSQTSQPRYRTPASNQVVPAYSRQPISNQIPAQPSPRLQQDSGYHRAQPLNDTSSGTQRIVQAYSTQPPVQQSRPSAGQQTPMQPNPWPSSQQPAQPSSRPSAQPYKLPVQPSPTPPPDGQQRLAQPSSRPQVTGQQTPVQSNPWPSSQQPAAQPGHRPPALPNRSPVQPRPVESSQRSQQSQPQSSSRPQATRRQAPVQPNPRPSSQQPTQPSPRPPVTARTTQQLPPPVPQKRTPRTVEKKKKKLCTIQ